MATARVCMERGGAGSVRIGWSGGGGGWFKRPSQHVVQEKKNMYFFYFELFWF